MQKVQLLFDLIELEIRIKESGLIYDDGTRLYWQDRIYNIYACLDKID